MRRNYPRSPRPLALLLLALLGMASAGCYPGVGWLPDSSGLVYTAGRDYTQLVHYDLAKGEAHVLVQDTGAATLCPAVSPDGRHVAVAKLMLKPKQKATTLQVVLYDRAGKQVQRSAVLPWVEMKEPATSETPTDKAMLPQLFWAPAGNQILVHTFGYCGVYDVKADRLARAGEGVLLTFGGTPFRPDGAGYLVMKNAQGWVKAGDKPGAREAPDPEFTFLRWDGKEEHLRPPPLLLDVAALGKEHDANKLAALLCPSLYDSAWDGDVASVAWNTDRLRYFTGKGEVVHDRPKPEKTADGLPIRQQYRFPGSQARVRGVVTHWDEKKPEEARDLRLEVVKPGVQAPEVLVAKTELAVLLPSPNRKRLAVRCFGGGGKGGKDGERLLVIDDQGKVVARPAVER